MTGGKIVTENFPDLWKEPTAQNQRSQRVPNKRD